MKKIILCADDYAQSLAISAGILRLLAAGRLSATSCMTESPSWRESAAGLRDLRGAVWAGLHFNLTHPFLGAGESQTLSRILCGALTGTLARDRVRRALETQLDKFEEVMETPPDFVDGHQHVHVFPVIRRIVIEVLTQRYGDRKPWLRSVSPPPIRPGPNFVKHAVLRGLGRGFAAEARAAGFATNGGFHGIYSLSPGELFLDLMDRWLREARQGDLIMCHPGLSAENATDPIRAVRARELEFLTGDDFLRTLERHDAMLAKPGDRRVSGGCVSNPARVASHRFAR